MKRFLSTLLIVVVASVAAFGQIAYVNSTSGGASCATAGAINTGICNIPYTPTNTADAIIGFARSNGNVTAYVADNNLFTLMHGAAATNATGYTYQAFAGFAVSGATSYNFNNLDTAPGNSDIILEYSGVGSFNLLPTVSSCPGGSPSTDGHSCTGTGTSPAAVVNLNESTDILVCGVTQGGVTGGGTVGSPFSGTNRVLYNTNPSQAIMEATGTSTASCGATYTASVSYRVVPIILRPSTVSNTQGVIRQITTTGYGPSGTGGPSACTVTSQNCKGQIAPPLAGDLLLVDFSDHSDFNDVQRTITSFYFCPVNTGCNSGNGYQPTFPGGNCTAYVQDAQPESDGQDTYYALSALGTEAYFDAVRSGANATSERQVYTVFDIIPPSGFHAQFDGCPAPLQQSTLASTFTMPTTTFSGSNEVVIDGFTGGVDPMTYSAPFLQGESIHIHLVFAMALGQSAGAGPTITAAGASNGGVAVVRTFSWIANSGGGGNAAGQLLLGVGEL